MAELGAAIQPVERGAEVIDDRKLGLRIADAQNPVHNSVPHDHPVHVPSRTLNADVVERSEPLAAEEVDCAQIDNQLLRHARVMLDETSQSVAVGDVYVASNGDAHPRGGQVVNFENSPAEPLRFIGRRQIRLTQRDGSGRGHSRTPLQAPEAMADI